MQNVTLSRVKIISTVTTVLGNTILPGTQLNKAEGTLSNATSRTILSTKSQQIEHATLSKGRNFVDIVAETGNIVAKNDNNVEATFDL